MTSLSREGYGVRGARPTARRLGAKAVKTRFPIAARVRSSSLKFAPGDEHQRKPAHRHKHCRKPFHNDHLRTQRLSRRYGAPKTAGRRGGWIFAFGVVLDYELSGPPFSPLMRYVMRYIRGKIVAYCDDCCVTRGEYHVEVVHSQSWR
jgi:hypothetical protein